MSMNLTTSNYLFASNSIVQALLSRQHSQPIFSKYSRL